MKPIYTVNKNIALVLIAFFMLLFTNQVKATCNFHAGFTTVASSNNCKSIYFTNTSYVTNASDSGVSYLWKLGTSIFASTKNANYTFATNGTYTICLIMFKQTSGGMCSDTLCQTITVNCATGCTLGTLGWNWAYNCSTRTVSFTGTNSDTSGSYHYTWGFGDQKYDTLNHLSTSHTYPNNGTYTVCMNIKKYDNGALCKDTTICKTVTVAGIHGTNFTTTISTANCKEAIFSIQDSNTCGIYTWSWGDNTSSTQTNKANTIGHAYAGNGTYTVCLIVFSCNDTTCATYKCNTVTINCNPCSTYANWSYSVACPSRAVTFTSGVGDTTGYFVYSWSFGDSSALGTLKSTTHTYSANGTYTVCLKIKRYVNTTSAPCFDTTICKTVTVNCTNTGCSLVGEWSYTIACPSRVGSFRAYVGDSLGAYSYSWNFGSNTATATTIDPHYTFANNGTYTVCLTIKRYIPGTTTVCKDTVICKTITVNCSSCNLAANFNVGVNCALKKVEVGNTSTGDSCFYSTWAWGDGTYSHDRSPAPHVYAHEGTYNVCLIIKKCTDTTCVNYICKTVIVPVSCCNSHAYFGATVKCADKKVEVLNYSYGDSCMTYKWSWGDGSYSTDRNPLKHIYAQAGTYNVCLKVTKCGDTTCSNTFCKTIVIPTVCCPTPNFYFYNFCNTYRFINTTVGGTSFWWSFGDSSFSSAKSPYHSFFSKRTFTVCLTVFDSVKHCTATVCKQVVVNCRWFGNHHFESPLSDGNIGDAESMQADPGANTDLTPSKGLQMNVQAGISAYPNPTNSTLNIILPASNATIRITDITGALLMEYKNISSFYKADVSGLAAGIYFVNVINENGTQSVRFLKN